MSVAVVVGSEVRVIFESSNFGIMDAVSLRSWRCTDSPSTNSYDRPESIICERKGISDNIVL